MQAAEVLDRARRVLLDETSVRWPLSELNLWLNDGLVAIAIQKPSATARTVALPLVAGTLQTIPEGYQCILRAVRNLRTAQSDRRPRIAITPVQEDVLSAQVPGWHDPYITRQTQQVQHIIFDEANPKTFYVYPGNDGTGSIEAVLSEIPAPVTPTGTDPEDLSAYEVDLPVDDTYRLPLVDYVLFRAYTKDAQFAGNAQRALAHSQLYANAMGIKIAAEANISPNAKPGVAAAAGGVS